MNLNWKRPLAAALIGLAASSVRAADLSTALPSALSDYVVQVWRREQGLPGNRVHAVLQTRDGYLWVATDSGLARFDGVTFNVLTRANTPAMMSSDCRALAEDEDGSLWVGTTDGLLHFSKHSLRRFSSQDGLPGSDVSALAARPGGGVWAIMHVGPLVWIEDKPQQSFGVAPALPIGRIRVLNFEAPSTLWVGTDWGLWELDARTGEIRQREQRPADDRQLVWAIHPDHKRRLWVVFTHEPGDNYLFYRDGTNWVQVGSKLTNGSRPVFFVEDATGYGWLPFQEGHLFRLNANNHGGVDVPIPWAGAEDFAISACLDQESSLWIGSENSGLYQLRRTPSRCLAQQAGLPSSSVFTALEARDGSWWVGTDRGAARVLDGRVLGVYDQAHGLARNDVTALAQDSTGAIWIGTGNGLDTILNGELCHHRFHRPPDGTDPDEIAPNKVRALLPSRDGTLWVATARGVHHLNREREELYDHGNGFLDSNVRALLEDRTGTLWMGTEGAGLSLVHGNSIVTFTEADGLTSNHIRCLYEDHEGAVWIGTERGLNRMAAGDARRITRQQGLPDDEVLSLLEDEHGWFWIGFASGLYRVRRVQLAAAAQNSGVAVEAISFDEADGWPGGELNKIKGSPIAVKAADGRFAFCTTTGLVTIDPDMALPPERAPAVIIEQVRANDHLVFGDRLEAAEQTGHRRQLGPGASSAGGRASRERFYDDSLRLAPGMGSVLEFHYTCGSFVAPEKARFKYRLEGYESTWHEVGTRRVAFYTNLSPGHYRFHVLAANHHNLWNGNGGSMVLYLVPFYYQTWWFRGGLILIGPLLVLGFFAWRFNELRKISSLERELALAQERGRIARDLHDGLGASITQLRLLAALAERDLTSTASAHNHLRNISQLTHEVARSLKNVVWLAHPDSDAASVLVSRLRDQAEQLFKPLGVGCHFEVEDLGSWRLGPAASQNVYLAALEGLNNIAQHAGATHVWVRSQLRDGRFKLSIESDGRPFLIPGPTDSTGHGLHTMRQRIESVEGTFNLCVRPAGGARINIEVNL